MKIDELLDKYFEGETSCEEERELRRFFTEEEVPEHLQTYRPLFAYLNREATSMAEPTEEKSVTTESAKEVPAQRKPFRLYRTFYAVSGIAAGLLLLLGVAKIIFPLSDVPENYVVIDGQRYTDEKLDLPASLCTCTRETANSRPIQQVWRAKGRDQGRTERQYPEILPHDYLQEPCVQECIPLSPGNSAGHCTRQAR